MAIGRSSSADGEVQVEVKTLRLNFADFLRYEPWKYIIDIEKFCGENLPSAVYTCTETLTKLVTVCTIRSFIPTSGAIGI